MKLIQAICLLVLFPLISIAQPAPSFSPNQNSEASFYPSGIWHKNMELKCNINFPYEAANEFFDMRDVNKMNGSNITSTQKLLSTCMGIDKKYSPKFSTPYENSQRVVFYDVTNINNGLPIVCEIRVVKTPNSDPNQITYHNLEFASMYQNIKGSNNSKDDHTYCVIGLPDLATVSTSGTQARALIVDLTEAMNLGGTSVNREIVIDNPKERNSAHLNGSTVMTNQVYIGYVKFEPEINRLHTIGFDNSSGILAISPLEISSEATTTSTQKKGYFELVNFSDIHLDPNYYTSDLVVPKVLTGGPIEVNLIACGTKVNYKTLKDGVIDNKNIDIYVAGYSLDLKRGSEEYYRNGYVTKMSMNLENHKITTDTTFKVNIQIDEEIIKYELAHPIVNNDEYAQYLPKPLTGNELKYQSQKSLRNILQNITSK